MSNITVKRAEDNWEVLNGHRRFSAHVAIGDDFQVLDMDSNELKLVQVKNGVAEIAANVVILKL